VPESDVFMPLGLGLSEKQIPQLTENTEKSKKGMELLESVGPRPRQARYHAAVHPDMFQHQARREQVG
jgi:hypothetical protein